MEGPGLAWVWLAIALLPMRDFLNDVLSVILLLIQWRDRGLWWPGAGLWLVVGATAAWLVRPAPDLIAAIPLSGLMVDTSRYLLRSGAPFIPSQ